MLITKSKLDNVLIIQPSIFEDHRGTYLELYNEADLTRNTGIKVKFIQDDISVSRQNVLRGIHGDFITWKLISCLRGAFYLIVVNNDVYSPQYRQWDSIVLSERNNLQVLVPPGFGNGHLVLSNYTIFHYKQSTYYDRDNQFTIAWNDPGLKIFWPIKYPILSDRDRGVE
jgi:dTDP-4-dehydrorhamnose 3,5-epimerase